MKYIFSILLIAICISPILFENVSAYPPTEEDLALVESMMNLEINRCELKTDETALQKCDEKIMEYVNIVCLQYGSLESGKCDEAQQYMRDRNE